MSIKLSVASEMEAVDKMKKVLEAREKASQEHFGAKLDRMNKMAEEVERRNARQNAVMAGQDPDLIEPAPTVETAPDASAAGDTPAGDEQPPVTNESPAIVLQDDLDYSKLVTRTINGKQVTKPLSDWLLQAEASEHQSYQPTNVAPVINVPEIDDEQLAKDLALGDPEASTAAIRTLKQSIVGEATRAINLEQAKLEGKKIWNDFLIEYPDIASDKMLMDLLIKIDSDLSVDGNSYGNDPASAFHKRVRVAGDKVRQWTANIASLSKKNELVEKKKQIHTLSSINTKQTQKETKELTEKEARDLAVREMMARRRARG
jgi:hypothetical protein